MNSKSIIAAKVCVALMLAAAPVTSEATYNDGMGQGNASICVPIYHHASMLYLDMQDAADQLIYNEETAAQYAIGTFEWIVYTSNAAIWQHVLDNLAAAIDHDADLYSAAGC